MRELLVPAAVVMPMVSIGMSLRPRGLVAGWRSVSLKSWAWARSTRHHRTPVATAGGAETTGKGEAR